MKFEPVKRVKGILGAMLVACILMGINANMDLTSPILPVLAMMIYLAGFETGPGPLFFLMASEAFPQDVRNEGLALSNFLCNAMNIFTSFMFPLLKGAMGIGNVFFFYGFMSLIGAAFIVLLPVLFKNVFVGVLGIPTDIAEFSQIILVGALIVFFLIKEPHGIVAYWRTLKGKLRLWPFPY